MASIKGRFEYDDDNLTPGQAKDGGLHQNLYDSDGRLKDHARFIPDDGEETDEPTYETVVIHEHVHVYDDEEERRREQARQENAELIIKAVTLLIAVATPHAKRLWSEKVTPVLAERRARRAARRAARKTRQVGVPLVEATVVDSTQELVEAAEVYRTDMTSAEAQARYLAALAARAFSDEQMRLVNDANIVDGEGLGELQRTLTELPSHQVAAIIAAVEADPSVLSADVLSQLGQVLRQGGAEPMPIEEQRDR